MNSRKASGNAIELPIIKAPRFRFQHGQNVRNLFQTIHNTPDHLVFVLTKSDVNGNCQFAILKGGKDAFLGCPWFE